MRIAANFSIPELEQKLQAKLPNTEWIQLPTEGSVTPFEADALLTLPVGVSNLSEVIQAATGLKWVHIFGTGADNFPMQAIQEQTLTCSRGATAAAIAEWVMAMILSHSKRLPESWVTSPPAAWNFADLQCLQEQTLGIIGFGAIGQAIAKRAIAFDMDVLACVRTYRESPMGNVTILRDLSELLQRSDHVVLALPATAESQQLINNQSLLSMKTSAHLINVARAGIVDHDALKQALDQQQLACASLDVTDPEPLPEGHWLYQHPKVRLSPHISWYSPKALDQMSDVFVDNAVAFSKGNPLSGVVDIKAGY